MASQRVVHDDGFEAGAPFPECIFEAAGKRISKQFTKKLIHVYRHLSQEDRVEIFYVLNLRLAEENPVYYEIYRIMQDGTWGELAQIALREGVNRSTVTRWKQETEQLAGLWLFITLDWLLKEDGHEQDREKLRPYRDILKEDARKLLEKEQ